MARKVLVAVGDCVYSRQAVTYAAKVSSAVEDLEYTLYNIQPMVPGIISECAAADPETRAELEALARNNAEVARCVVGELKELIVEQGVAPTRIEVVTDPMQAGLARDILTRGEEGRFEAIILARRGLTPSRDFFIGTTAAKVLEHALHIPVWVVDGGQAPLDMLVAVDGSKNSLHLLDHLMRMVGPNPELRLTLYHVVPSLRHYYSVEFEADHPKLHAIMQRKDKENMEGFYHRAYAKLKEHGIQEAQIRAMSSTPVYDVSTALLREAKSGGYGTVIIGRRGEREAFFTGRIAIRMIQKISEQALWVVP